MNDSDGDYARILRRLIDDPDYQRLPSDARFVWLTLLIAPELRVLGIGIIEPASVARRTGLPLRQCDAALETLEHADRIRRDGAWIWVRNHLRFQENSEAWRKSSDTMSGLSRRVNNLPSGLQFLREFLELYKELGFRFDIAPRIARALDTLPHKGPPTRANNPEPETPETPRNTLNQKHQEPEPEPETQTLELRIREAEYVSADADAPPPPRDVVFDHWRAVMRKPKAKLDAKRRKAIDGRLRDGYSVEDLCLAIDGCRRSTFHQGVNDRGKAYNDIELICRDSKRVDQFLDIAQHGEPRPMSPTTAHNIRALGIDALEPIGPLEPAVLLPANKPENAE